jgi:hypothetical protein
MFDGLQTETVILYGIMKSEQIARRYLDNLRNTKISITGQDLQKIGIPPSKKYSDCFDYILKEKLRNPNITKEEEIIFAKKYFEQI